MEFGIANVAVITVLVYLVGMAVKESNINDKWIPTICGVAGVILGIVAFWIGVPDFPATDFLTAAAVGCASGLAATGVDQAVKQLKNKE